MTTTVRVRDATTADLDAIAGHNQRLARETEDRELDRLTIEQGVRAALIDPERLRYWVAESSGPAPGVGVVIGQAAVSREWSDWRNGWFWWLQSVYVRPEDRGRGVFRALYHEIRSQARQAGDVVGLRLYVERANDQARRAYQALGMADGGYHVFEEVWPTAPPER